MSFPAEYDILFLVIQMMIIIAPAKRMRGSIDFMDAEQEPVFLNQSRQLIGYLKTKTCKELQSMLGCNTAIAQWTYDSYQQMELTSSSVPALLSFDGIQYSYMAPDLFSDEYFAYARKHPIRTRWYSASL